MSSIYFFLSSQRTAQDWQAQGLLLSSKKNKRTYLEDIFFLSSQRPAQGWPAQGWPAQGWLLSPKKKKQGNI